MVGKIRDALNEAPPWVSYSIVGVALVAAVGLVAWQLSGGQVQSSTGDKHFYCEECENGFTLSAEDARQKLLEASGVRLKCPACGKVSCAIGQKCLKCGTYFPVPKRTEVGPDDWRDECPKCGYSHDKAEAVKAAKELMKQGKWDPAKQPRYILKAVEEAEEAGETGEQ